MMLDEIAELIRQRKDSAVYRKESLAHEMSQAWAKLNGWHEARHQFTAKALIERKVFSHDWRDIDHGHGATRTIDHGEYFRLPIRPYFSVAIVAHLYGHAADAIAWARENGMVAHMPPVPGASWYYPARCIVVCYTRLDITTVQWLPEQSDPKWKRTYD